jgi:hypothetical protein
MAEEKSATTIVDKFILDQIETVPHLEALLLTWGRRPQDWTAETMAKALYVPQEVAGSILRDLAQRNLLREVTDRSGTYTYASGTPERDELIAHVDRTYRRELIRISRMIHSKAPAALLEFARAFRFTKEKD